MDQRAIGILGENLAVAYLKQKGYLIKERNFRRKWGEIDIVAYDKKTKEWIFVEVKTTNNPARLPEEQLTSVKKQKLKRIILTYLSYFGLEEQNWRVDVIGVILQQGSLKKLHHYQSIFFDFSS